MRTHAGVETTRARRLGLRTCYDAGFPPSSANDGKWKLPADLPADELIDRSQEFIAWTYAESALMGFLKKFFRNVYQEESSASASSNSFETLTEDQLEAHLGVTRYGSFVLSDAVRPAFDLTVVPSEGYRHDQYRDDASKQTVPVLMGSASRERLFETFMELLDPLGAVVDVVLETSHDYATTGHRDLYREHIDAPILQSILWDFEDLLVNDGCTGIAVLNPRLPQEVQFDEHKLLIVYGKDLREYEAIFGDCGLPRRDEIRFITEAEHVHSTNDDFIGQFEELKMRLGMESEY